MPGRLAVCANSELDGYTKTIAIPQNVRLPRFCKEDFKKYMNTKENKCLEYSINSLMPKLKSVSDSLQYRAILAESGNDKPESYIHVFDHDMWYEPDGFSDNASVSKHFTGTYPEQLPALKLCLLNALETAFANDIESLGFDSALVANLSISCDWSLEGGGRYAVCDSEHPVHRDNLNYVKAVLNTFANHLRLGRNPAKIFLGLYDFDGQEKADRDTKAFKKQWESTASESLYA